MRLVMVAAPADAAERASREDAPPSEGPRRVEESAAKCAAYRVVHRASVGVLAGELRHYGFHDLSDVLDRRGAGLGDRRSDRRLDVFGAQGGRQIVLEHGDLAGLLGDEVRPASIRELLDRIASLLDERGDD